MKFFRTCPHCGSNLDPGEKCDCQKHREHKERKEQKYDEKNRKVRH